MKVIICIFCLEVRRKLGSFLSPKCLTLGLKWRTLIRNVWRKWKVGTKPHIKKALPQSWMLCYPGPEPGSTQSDSLDRLKMVKGKSLRSTNKAPVFKQNLWCIYILYFQNLFSEVEMSFFSYVRNEITRSYMLDQDQERYTSKREKMYTFMRIPRQLS